MKHINQYLFEAAVAATTINFQSMSQFLIFKFELEGQISDGYWENARPNNHWRWISDLEYTVNENEELGYRGPAHRIKYSTRWLISYLNKAQNGDKEYQWANRFLKYGKAGSLFKPSDINKFNKYGIRHVIEELPDEPVTWEELVSKAKDWEKKYFDDAKDVITDAFLKKFYKAKYSIKDFKADLSDVEEAMNNKL